jgi:8-amino-7-oxononanoate synthase
LEQSTKKPFTPMTLPSEAWIPPALASLRESHLERKTTARAAVGGKLAVGDRTFLNFASNDYLDLAADPRVTERAGQALRTYGAGSTASRLVAGTLDLHEELEHLLAGVKGYPAALLFGSGYMANAGTIAGLVGRSDRVYADRLVHASVIDAVALSKARLARFRHNDPTHLAELLAADSGPGRSLVVTESVFSMDGDCAPLPELAAVAQRHQAMLMVDEAHATGVFGPGGSGLIRAHGLQDAVNVSMGTLSKALGGYGGFVACSEDLRALLVNRARAFIYTTAPPPAAVGAALGALEVLREHPGLGASLLERSAAFRAMLHDRGADTLQSASQIVPVLIGDNAAALSVSRRLYEQGLIAPAIRPPTVPRGTARLRLSVTLAHDLDDLAHAADLVAEAMLAEGPAP